MTAGTAAKAVSRRQLNSHRTVLTDAMWAETVHMPPGKKFDPGGTAADNRHFLGAALWRFFMGSPWRDIPKRFGNWYSVFVRFRRFRKRRVSGPVCSALSDGFDFGRVRAGGAVMQAHRKASGAPEAA